MMKNKKILKTLLFLSFFVFIPKLVFADTASDISNIDGAKNLVKFFDIFMRGIGCIVIFYGTGETFLKLGNTKQSDRIKGLTSICCGFLMVCSYSIICKICDISSYNSFQLMLSLIAFFVKTIGVFEVLHGAYKFSQSFSDQDGEAKRAAFKIIFNGAAAIAIAQCSSSFLM